MKILSEPSKKPWVLETSCQECETRLEVEIGDFKKTISDQRDGDATVFACPTCGRENWVALDRVPRHLHHKLPRAW